MLLMTAFNASAQNPAGKIYYVLSGESFQLKPALGNLAGYVWKDNGTDITSGIAADGTLTYTFDLATGTTAAVTKTLSLGILDVVGGCLSNLVNHTVVVLPKLLLTLTPAISDFCNNLTTISTTITASLTDIPASLATYGVTIASTYKWFKGEELLSETGPTLTVTDIGTYRSERVYNLPTDGSFKSDGGKVANAILGSAEIKKDKVVPNTPDIQLL
jgi:hypothetical protein